MLFTDDLTLPFSESLQADYMLTFAPGADETLYSTTFLAERETVLGQDVLLSRGLGPDYSNGFPCLDRERNTYLESFGPLSNMSFCLNSSEQSRPSLSFDYTEFAADPDAEHPELNDVSRNLRILLFQNDEETVYIVPAGVDAESKRVVIDLPEGFTGNVTFDFYNVKGDFNWRNSDPNLERFDYIMVDNVVWTDRSISSKDLPERSLSILPNPARDYFEFQLPASQGEGELKVYDALGLLVYSQKTDLGQSPGISSSGWPAGFYVVEHQDVNGQRAVGRLILE